MKKILVIAYYFPPAAGVGTFRIAKFVKYLPLFGWEPVILTVKEKYYKNKDNSLISDFSKKIKIYRTDIMNFPINNADIKWLPFLFKDFRKVIKKEKPNLLYFTGGPFFQWRLAPFFKRKYNIPYIIDFRDPWFLDPYEKEKSILRKNISEFLKKKWELLIIKNADKVIFATTNMEKIYRKEYNFYKEKFLSIENGYDPDDYKNVPPKKNSNFSIVYTGKFAHYRDPKNFFKALGKLKNIIDFQFMHIGEKEKKIEKIIKKERIEKKSLLVGLKTYKETISHSKGADVLVLITGKSKLESTQKVFDYVACDKPIIAITNKNSAVARVLKNFKKAFVIDDNPEIIKDAIIKIYKDKTNNVSFGDQKIMLDYNRKFLTKKLAECLDRVVIPDNH
ncbi:MAG: glycosyltransferase [Candidatus Pacebacteria bacterium]|nr:glycosyltransferase [Candidatus Paceibacterota bacterium]